MRMAGGSLDAVVALAREAALPALPAPFTRQAGKECPAALTVSRRSTPPCGSPTSPHSRRWCW